MATMQEITSHPKWAQANSEQKRRILSRASDAPTSLKVMASAESAIMRPARYAAKLGTDPVEMAGMLPAVTGTLGAMGPVPFGATLGTGIGRQVSNLALRGLGKEEKIPSTMRQALELGLSALGDVGPIPAINRGRFGRAVGEAEKKAGVPEFVKSLKRPGGPAATTKWIDDTFEEIGTGTIARNEPTIIKQIKDQIDFIYQNKKNVPISKNDQGKLKFLGRWAQEALNASVKGRRAAARNLKMSQGVPNVIKSTLKAIPSGVKWGIGASIPLAGASRLFFSERQ